MNNESQTISVEDLKSQLLRQKITSPRFRWYLTRENGDKLLTAAYIAEVEARHRRPEMDDMTLRNISQVSEFLTSKDSKFGLMLCGLCGNGKTTMLSAIQNATNYLVKIGHYKDIAIYEKLIDSYRRGEVGLQIIDSRAVVQLRSKDFHEFDLLRSKYMLAIDDLGTEPTEVMDYGNILSPVIELLEHRYDHQLFTILTTNATPKDIREKYGVRMADRFNEMMKVIPFENPSYRR